MEGELNITYLKQLIEWLTAFAPRLLLSIVILIIGMWIVKKLAKGLIRLMEKANLDPEISGFFKSMASLALQFIVILMAAGTLGLEVSSILGILAGVVFVVGLALQGFLGNFPAGLTIVFFKP
jgi:small conductance mechanosensitive channel